MPYNTLSDKVWDHSPLDKVIGKIHGELWNLNFHFPRNGRMFSHEFGSSGNYQEFSKNLRYPRRARLWKLGMCIPRWKLKAYFFQFFGNSTSSGQIIRIPPNLSNLCFFTLAQKCNFRSHNSWKIIEFHKCCPACVFRACPKMPIVVAQFMKIIATACVLSTARLPRKFLSGDISKFCRTIM